MDGTKFGHVLGATEHGRALLSAVVKLDAAGKCEPADMAVVAALVHLYIHYGTGAPLERVRLAVDETVDSIVKTIAANADKL